MEEKRKLTTGQGEEYTTGCLLDYEYIIYHYWIRIRYWSKINLANRMDN